MFTQSTFYVASAGDLEKAMEKLACASVVAVDLEADSMHHFEEKVCLIQMAANNYCFIIDPLAISDLSPLAPVFSNGSVVKIFHGADYDVRSLFRDFAFCIENLFDTELACRFLGYSHSSLEAVVKKHFNAVIDKTYQKKDWSVRPLAQEMIAYAADDVLYLPELYRELAAALMEKNRYDWAVETCKDLCSLRHDEKSGGGGPLFLKIKGAGKLDSRSLAVLENLAVLRQKEAKKKDRPPYRIINNNALIGLAQKKPGNMASLYRSGIISKKQCGMYGDSIVTAISRALEIPKEKLPAYPKTRENPLPPVVTRRIKALKKWREDKGRQLEMDPSMLINNGAIKKIAKHAPGNLSELKSMEIVRNWQAEEFGTQWIDTIQKAI